MDYSPIFCRAARRIRNGACGKAQKTYIEMNVVSFCHFSAAVNGYNYDVKIVARL